MQQFEENLTDSDIEFVGALEDVTAGWSGPTDDFIDGDWNP